MNKRPPFFDKSSFWSFFFLQSHARKLGVWLIHECGIHVHLYMSAAYTQVVVVHELMIELLNNINQTKEQSNIFPLFNPLCSCSFTIGENDEVNLNECQELERLQSV